MSREYSRLPFLLENKAEVMSGSENRRAKQLMRLAAQRIRELESMVAESDFGSPEPAPQAPPPAPKSGPGYTVRRITFK